MSKVVAIVVLSLCAGTAAYAKSWHAQSHIGWASEAHEASEASGTGGAVAAPEIDPSGAMAGLSLLAGGLAVLRGRRSKK